MNGLETPQAPDNEPKTRVTPLPSRDQVTSIQIHTLLHAAQVLNTLLPSKDEDGATVNRKDGGICSAVETSIIKICDRLDAITDDVDRWTLTNQRLLEQQLSDVYTEHLSGLRAQKLAMEHTTAPHQTAGVSLLKLEDGSWAAVLGNAKNIDNCIVGHGACPADALKNFDDVFRGKQKEQQ